MNELKEINDTLKKIEKKIEDKNIPKYSWTRFLDFEKLQEGRRQDREDERNEEILEIQKNQFKMMEVQTESIKKQENFNRIVAFTGGIVALTAIYAFIVQSVNLEKYPQTYWVITPIFLLLVIICLGPLIKFITDFWKKEVFGK